MPFTPAFSADYPSPWYEYLTPNKHLTNELHLVHISLSRSAILDSDQSMAMLFTPPSHAKLTLVKFALFYLALRCILYASYIFKSNLSISLSLLDEKWSFIHLNLM